MKKFLLSFLVVLLVSSLFVSVSSASLSQSEKAQLNQALKKVNAAKKALAKAQEVKAKAERASDLAIVNRDSMQTVVTNTDTAYQAAVADLTDVSTDLDDARDELADAELAAERASRALQIAAGGTLAEIKAAKDAKAAALSDLKQQQDQYKGVAGLYATTLKRANKLKAAYQSYSAKLIVAEARVTATDNQVTYATTLVDDAQDALDDAEADLATLKAALAAAV